MLSKDEFIIKINTHTCPHLERSQYCTFCIIELANEVYDSSKITVERVKAMIEERIEVNKTMIHDSRENGIRDDLNIACNSELNDLLAEINEAEDDHQ